MAGALISGYHLIACKVLDPAKCNSFHHDFRWTVSVKSSNASASNLTTSIDHAKQHIVFSTIDFMSSCDALIMILCLQLLFRSIFKPGTTCILKKHFELEELHKEELRGCASVSSRLFGTQTGVTLDRCSRRWFHWILGLVCACEVWLCMTGCIRSCRHAARVSIDQDPLFFLFQVFLAAAEDSRLLWQCVHLLFLGY